MGAHKESGNDEHASKDPAVRLRPNRSVLIVRQDHIRELDSDSVSWETVGYKAFGLACLPQEWVPRYFVIDASCLCLPPNVLRERIESAFQMSGIAGPTIIIRSSGASETMGNRVTFPLIPHIPEYES